MLSREFGDFVHYRGLFQFYLINHPSLVKQVLQETHEAFNKQSEIYNRFANVFGDGLVVSEGASWRRQRKLIQPLLGPKSVERYFEGMVDSINRMLKQWELARADGRVLDVLHEMNRLTLEIAGRALFQDRFEEKAHDIERWTHEQLDLLDAHFAQYNYLLGSRPCLGDFGLIGPLYAHLGRDPWPARELIAKRPNLHAWVKRMMNPPQAKAGHFLADDAIPDTLLPLLKSVFNEFWPQLQLTLAEMERTRANLKPGRGWSRMLGMIDVPMANATLRVGARPFSLWMAQRSFDTFHALPAAEQASVQELLSSIGAGDALKLAIPRLRQVALRVAPE